MRDADAMTDSEPIVKRIVVPLAVETAFRRFTSEMDGWWPTDEHSVGGERTVAVILEGHLAGRLYERERDGTEHEWGRVTAWDPPGRVCVTWHPGRAAATEQEVDVRFRQHEGGTELELIHRGWEVLGDAATEMRRQYVSGWERVLDRYAEAS